MLLLYTENSLSFQTSIKEKYLSKVNKQSLISISLSIKQLAVVILQILEAFCKNLCIFHYFNKKNYAKNWHNFNKNQFYIFISNRSVLGTKVSDLHFCPNIKSKEVIPKLKKHLPLLYAWYVLDTNKTSF